MHPVDSLVLSVLANREVKDSKTSSKGKGITLKPATAAGQVDHTTNNNKKKKKDKGKTDDENTDILTATATTAIQGQDGCTCTGTDGSSGSTNNPLLLTASKDRKNTINTSSNSNIAMGVTVLGTLSVLDEKSYRIATATALGLY